MNYLTAPECVIWSAVLASAAVPAILNPVVMMMKTSDGTLAPYSFGRESCFPKFNTLVVGFHKL